LISSRFEAGRRSTSKWLSGDADHVVDDELGAGQTDAGVRQLGEIEGQFGLPTFIMTLSGISGNGDVAEVTSKSRSTAVNVAGIAFVQLTVTSSPSVSVSVASPQPTMAECQFAGDDRRVAGTAATVGDDGGRASSPVPSSGRSCRRRAHHPAA
jgi:hypothetical protein